DTPTGLMVKIAHDDPPAIASFNPRLPAVLARIIGKCLEKERERRYSSAQELLAELKKLQEGRTSAPRRPLARMVPIAVAVALLMAAWAFLPGPWRRWLPGGGPRITRLAVLPLANLSGDSSQEYFAD